MSEYACFNCSYWQKKIVLYWRLVFFNFFTTFTKMRARAHTHTHTHTHMYITVWTAGTNTHKPSCKEVILYYTFVESLRPIQMLQSHIGIPRTTTSWQVMSLGGMFWVPRTTTRWQETPKHRNKSHGWTDYISPKTTNSVFHSSYVKGCWALIMKYNVLTFSIVWVSMLTTGTTMKL